MPQASNGIFYSPQRRVFVLLNGQFYRMFGRF
jgi:hypothetical protein